MTVTVLVADVVGSAALATELGDDAADSVRHAWEHVFSTAIESCAGREVKRLGDGVLATFESSVAALEAGRRMQRQISQLQVSGEPLRMRAGVSAGEVALEDGDIHGRPVVEASRLCDTAEAGEVLLSDVVGRLAGSRGDVELEEAGAHELKGLPGRVQALRLLWRDDAGSNGGWEIDVFGRLRVRRDGAELEPPGAVGRTIVAMLVLAGAEGVSVERLVDAVWDDDPPSSARKTLQAHVSKLRRLLEPARQTGDPSVIVSEGSGYRIEIGPDRTDVGRFRRAAAEAGSASEWREAVDLGSGEPLRGCVDSWPVEAERRVLEEEWITAVESWVEAALEEDQPEQVVRELERLVRRYPVRERLWAHLMRALDATGRQSEALATYQRARDTLIETAGVEPGPDLRAAQQAVLERAPAAMPESRHGDVQRVPARRGSLLGRDRDLLGVADLLTSCRLVTVLGPGGTGKTELASEVGRTAAQEFPGGVVFVDLTSTRRDAEVEGTVAAATGVRMVGDREGLLRAVRMQLRGASTLLVLDNCEHVRSGSAVLVDQLLDEVDGLSVLTTSRVPLGVAGEMLWRLEPLAIEDAMALFLQRMQARSAQATRTADRDAVRELCDRLDRLPLAIELAAARTDHLRVEEILAETTNRLDALRRLETDEGRHDSLESTIRWSYELLDGPAQAMLRRLGILRGAFDRTQAAGVAGDVLDPEQATDLLGVLVTHSLVTCEQRGGRTLYRLLDTIAAFAAAELDRTGETREAQRRHRDWYVQLARSHPRGHFAFDLSSALSLERHQADLVAALEHTRAADEPETLTELVMLAAGLSFCPAGLSTAGNWVDEALRRRKRIPSRQRADLLAVAMQTLMLRDEMTSFRELFEESIPLVRQDPDGVGPLAVGMALIDVDLLPRACAVFDDLLDEHRSKMRPEVLHDAQAMRPFATLVRSRDPAVALADAEARWQGRPWRHRRTLAGWTLHAGLLHVNGRNEALRARLDSMERSEAERAMPYFVPFFRALVEAAEGHRERAFEHLRESHDLASAQALPGYASDLVGAAAAVLILSGDEVRGRDLLDRPGFRARHAGTGIVHTFYRRMLGLSLEGFIDDWWTKGDSEELVLLLEEVLDA